MRDEIAKLIREIYVEKKTDLFVQECRRKLSFLDDLIRRIGEMADKVDRWPCEKELAEQGYERLSYSDIEEEFFPARIPLKECDREKYLTVFQALFMDYNEIND
jgi:hypothetical protein